MFQYEYAVGSERVLLICLRHIFSAQDVLIQPIGHFLFNIFFNHGTFDHFSELFISFYISGEGLASISLWRRILQGRKVLFQNIAVQSRTRTDLIVCNTISYDAKLVIVIFNSETF